ncbi:MAG: TldD/PmbA family protein [Bacteroidetes bacterium]|nr:TldD/PmbA family protein [Bacteroidota bacterium]
MQHFEVDLPLLQHLIQTALYKGGDYADLYFEQSDYGELSLRDGAVNQVAAHTDYGMGVRTCLGEQTGYAYTETTLPADMMRASQTAATIVSGDGTIAAITPKYIDVPQRYPILVPLETYALEAQMPWLQRLHDTICAADPRVNKVMARLAHSTNKILFFNSLGEFGWDIRPMITLSVSCVMEHKGRIENTTLSRSMRMGAEFLQPELVEELAREAVARTSFLFEARQPKGGEMAVVMGSGGSGILLHEAIGHAFEADFNRKQTSIFSDKLHRQICRKGINVIDDGTLSASRGAVNMDDEGVPGQKTFMVQDGVLHSYLHDRMSASWYKTEPTGNGRRESFRYMPIPRMRATYMENGTASEADLIAEVKKGVFVEHFSNGQVQIGAGDFTFYVKSGYLIENGKRTQPIKDLNIIGNGPQALADIEMVANNGRMDNSSWTCGKGQSCPVSCGMPSVLVRKLTVGGV